LRKLAEVSISRLSLRSMVDLTHLATLPKDCVCLTMGHVDILALMSLQSNEYEFAPVVAVDQAIGFVKTKDAAELSVSQLPLSTEHLISSRLPSSSQLDLLCKTLAVDGAALVIDQTVSDQGTAETWIGFITASDLNRHHFRAIVYGLLAEIEVGLAQMIKECRIELKSWLRALSDDSQARVLGYWELAKLRGVDTGPLSACTLTDLLDIAKSDPEIV
jgi:hypothetical protein